MAEHKDRLKTIGMFASPPKGTPEYDSFVQNYEARHKNDPNFKKFVKESFNKAVGIIKAQNANGAGLPLDSEIRFFLREYNGRNFKHGLRSMPTSFNLLESFFRYRPDIQVFELLDEEDLLFSFFDFFDYLTSPAFKEDPSKIKDNFVENRIYHFNIINELEDVTFTTEEGEEYVIGGISMVRRGTEVSVFLLSGLITDTAAKTEELKSIDFENGARTPGREDLSPAEGYKVEAVKLFDKSGYWKTLAYCRIDLAAQTIDARTIQKDAGISFLTITDDVSALLDHNGKFFSPDLEDTYKKMIEDLNGYAPIFEVALKSLYLPQYFNEFEDLIVEEQRETDLTKERRPIFRKEKIVPNKFMIRNRPVLCIDRGNQSLSDMAFLSEGAFRTEDSGYWKSIDYNSLGRDKNGNPIHGRTWVSQTLTWHEDKNKTLAVNLSATKRAGALGGNEGNIYIMRNASHAIDIFKIGFTTRDAKTRAKELSNTTGTPDKFLVAQEWRVSDCVQAEKLIHEMLASYRVNDRREFFKIDYETAVSTISGIVRSINETVNKP